VIPVPDTGTLRLSLCGRSGITYGEALIKNRYIGRTFINPKTGAQAGIRMKFNPLSSAIQGKRLVVGRFHRARQHHRALVRVLFERGQGSAPAHQLAADRLSLLLRHRHGRQDEFIAFGKTVDEISEELGATSVPISRLRTDESTRVGERRPLLRCMLHRRLSV